MYTNPVIHRELISSLRRAKTLWGLFITLLFVTAIFCFNYSFVLTDTTLDGMRPLFFFVIGVSLLSMFTLVVSAAVSITGEREKDTLDLVITTPLSTASLAFGKLAATLAYSMLRFSAFLPFITLCMLIGGVSQHDLIQGVLIVFASMILAATLGICTSLLVQRNNTATNIAMLLLFAYLLVPIPVLFTIRYIILVDVPSQPTMPVDLVVWLNPFWSLGYMAQPSTITTTSALQLNGIFAYLDPNIFPGYTTAFLMLVFSLILFWLTVIYATRKQVLNQPRAIAWNVAPPDRKKPDSNTTDAASLDHDFTSPFSTRDWVVYERERLIANRRWYTKDWFSFLLSFVVTGMLVWYVFEMTNLNRAVLSSENFHYTVCTSFIIASLFLIPFMAGSTLRSEYQNDTWFLLRTTRLRSMDIIRNQGWKCLRYACLQFSVVIASLFINFSVFSILYRKPIEYPPFTQIIAILILFTCCAFLYIAVGMVFSFVTRKATLPPVRVIVAWMVVHWGLALFLYLATMMIGSILNSPGFFNTGNMRAPSPFVEDIASTILWWTPLMIFNDHEWSVVHYTSVAVHCVLALSVGYILFLGAKRMIMHRD